MADKQFDYTQVGRDTTFSSGTDYTKTGKSNKALTTDYTALPTVGPHVDKLMNDTASFLQEQGYAPDTLKALMSPVGQLKEPMALDSLYKELRPTLERNIKGVEEALKMSQVMSEEFGTTPTFSETEALMSLFERFGSEALDNISEAHKWWIGAKRKVGDIAADKFSGVMVNVGLGMALIDSIDAFDKEGMSSVPIAKHIPIVKSFPGKLDVLRAEIPGTKTLPQDQIHDIENRVMPKLILDNRGQNLEFDTSSAAALWVLQQRLYAFGEKTYGTLGKLARAATPFAATIIDPMLDRWTGNEPINDFFTAMQERGKEREQLAVGVVPPLVAAMGEPSTHFGSGITWTEIAERKLGLEQEMDSMYKWMADPGALTITSSMTGPIPLSTVTAGLWWMANGALDAVAVPSTLIGGMLYKAPAATKAITRAIPGGQKKLSQLAVERAHSTRRLDDVFEAMSEATRHMDDVDAKYAANVQANLQATGETKVSAPIWKEWMIARRQLNNVKQLDDLMKDPSPAEILLEVPRRHPKMLMPPPDDASPVAKEFFKYRKEHLETGPSYAPRWDKADLPSFQQRKVMGPDDVEQAGVGLEALQKTGGAAIDDIMITNVMPEYNVTPAHGPIDWVNWQNVPLVKARAAAEQRFIESISGRGLPEPTTIPKNVWKRQEVAGPSLKIGEHPRGHYFSPLESTAQTHLKDVPVSDLVTPNLAANVLEVPARGVAPGLSTLDKLFGKERANWLRSNEWQDLIKTAKHDYPNVAWDEVTPEKFRTHGEQFDMDVLEMMAAAEARKQGYDAIRITATDPNLSEFVALTSKAVKPANLTIGQPKFSENQSLRMLIQEEDIIKRNLGTARNLKQSDGIRIHTKNLEEIRTVIDKVKNQGLKPESKIYDDIFFPADNPTIMSSPERFNRWMNIAGDRVLRSLYPGAMQMAFYNSSTGQLHALSRHDPVRYYEAMSPETWNVVRINMLRESQANMAWVSRLRDTFEKAGVIKKVKNFEPKKMTHDYVVDKEKSKHLYDYLNTKPTDPEYAALREVMPKEVTEAHDAIRELLETAKDIQGIRGDEYLEGYIHHMLPKELFDQGARPIAGMGLPKDVELLASHLFKRKGNGGYKRDAVAAMELYGRFMHRKMYRQTAIDAIMKTGDDLYEKTGNSAHRYFASMFTRQLEGKPGFLGEMLDAYVGSTVKAMPKPAAAATGGAVGAGIGAAAGSMVGLPGEGAAIGGLIGGLKASASWAPDQIGRTLMGVTSLTYMSMLGGNPRYALMQLATAIPTTASRFGLFRTMGGLLKMGTREGQALAKDVGVYQSFIDILEEPTMRRASKFIFEKWPAITPFGPMTNAKAEMLSRGMTMHASVGLHLTKAGFATLDEAKAAGKLRTIMFQALRDSEQANHMYGALGRNPIISRTLGQGFSTAATQFLSFIPKQTDELLSQALRDPGMLGTYLIMSGWSSKIAAQELGINISDYNGLGYLPAEGQDISSPGMDLMISFIKYSNAHNNYDPAEIDIAARNLLDSAANAIPAKIQVTSAIKAVNRMREGKITTSEGELLMPMDFKDQTVTGTLLGEGGAIDAPGPGPQIFPTLLQQRDVKETLVRRGLQFSKKNDTRFLYALQTALTDFANSVEAGDEEAANKLGEKLEDTYKIRLGGPTAAERAIEARYINEVVRYWHPKFGGGQKLLDQRLRTLERYGIDPSGERVPGEGEGLPDEEFQQLMEGEQ